MQDNTQLISILIPTYNRDSFLSEAIRSVTAQTYSNWELIVVDDGSTDNTREVIAQISTSLQYIYQPNAGVSQARNQAFAVSSGDYVLFLDSDDWLLPEALQTLITVLKEHPEVDVVYGDEYLVDEQGRVFGELSSYRQAKHDNQLETFVMQCPVSIRSTLIRRQALTTVSGPFDPLMVNQEDHDLFIRLKAAGCNFLFVPNFIACYRFHGGNASAPKSKVAEKHRQSQVYGRFKVLDAPWFPTLAAAAKQKFFLDFLTGPLQQDFAGQQHVLTHPNFLSLPAKTRSRLLYYLVIENLLQDIPACQTLRRLLTAIRLHPQNVRLYVWLSTFLLGRRFQKWLIRRYRHARSDNEQVDPVIEVLRSKGAA